MNYDVNTLPEEVRNFVLAVQENARKHPMWAARGDEFINTLLCVEKLDDGGFTISDSYEKFFSLIYTYTADGKWLIRNMWSEQGDRPYSYDKAMCDANIMYTG